MNRIERIKQKLSVLKPHYLEIIDETYLHANHLPQNFEQTHLRIKISSLEFSNQSIINKHKIINKILVEEFSQGLHALSINIK